MDPLTAWANATKAIAEMVTEIVSGQPPDVKAKVWEWYVADVERMRKFFKID
jgi:hypothetical protein